MVYLIIFLAMVLVIGPVFWIRPSKAERKLAKIRNRVMKQGVKVETVSLKSDTYYQRVAERNLHISDYQWVRYRYIAKGNDKGPSIKGQWTQRKDRSGQLLWEPDPVTLKEPEAVARMLQPWRSQQDVRFLALEFGPRTVSVVWNERGSMEEVETLIQQIQQLFDV